MRDDDDGSMRDLCLVLFLSRCHEGTVLALYVTSDVIIWSCAGCVERVHCGCCAPRRWGGGVCALGQLALLSRLQRIGNGPRATRCGLGDRFGDRQLLAHFRMLLRSIRGVCPVTGERLYLDSASAPAGARPCGRTWHYTVT